MKTLQDIKEGFKTDEIAKIQKVELENSLTYYFTDYTDMKISSMDNNNPFIVGKISQYKFGHEFRITWYNNQDKFDAAIKRHLAKQK